MGIDLNRLIPPAAQLGKAPDYELPPDQFDAWQVFDSMWTQWRTTAGFSRVVFHGLDYIALEAVMRMRGIEADEQKSVFQMCRVMEDEAIRLRNK